MKNSHFCRVAVAFAVMCASVLAVSFRLMTLCVGDNRATSVLSGQYTRKRIIAEKPGLVYDRDGEPMSHKTVGACAIVNPMANTDKNLAIAYLSENSGYSFDEILEKYRTPEPFTVTLDKMPSVTPPVGIYVYPLFEPADNGFCRHLLGYCDSDGNGVSGVFGKWNAVLAQSSGTLSIKYQSDAVGGMLDGTLCIENDGYTQKGGVVLTIDSEIQSATDKICDEKMQIGAVAICEIATGELVCLSSRPLYERNSVASVLESGDGELVNRAFSLYTPGSVFKAVTAVSALEKDVALFDFEYECTGECDVSGKRFHCHKSDGHGVQNMSSAFANSCNTYFISLAEEVGFEYICEICTRLGIGKVNAVDGLYQPSASVPDVTSDYPPAYRANVSFGQGDLAVTPCDMLMVYSACVSGCSVDLSCVRGVYSDDGYVAVEKKAGKRVLSDETVMLLRQMMKECVENGTGKNAKCDGVSVGGKTATAQSGQKKDGVEVLHRWFAGAFPIDEPEYAVVVLCDGNGDNAPPGEIFSACVEAVVQKNKKIEKNS